MRLLPILSRAGLLALPATAAAQGLETHHPVIPSAGIASENGPGTMWVNPANLSYDPDTRYGLFFSGLTTEQGPASRALTAGTGGFGLGVHNLVREDLASEGLADWSLDYATGIALPERLSVGVLLSWRFVDGGDNYVGYDAGLSWRPLPWVGFGAVAQNISSPDPNGMARPRTGGGVALRPFRELLVVGLDYARLFAPDEGPTTLPDVDTVQGSVRIRPTEGLYLRGGVEGVLGDEGGVELVRGGLGLELYFEGIGGGYHQSVDPELEPGAFTGWIGTAEPGESFLRGGRRVPQLELEGSPPYEPRITLLSLDPGPSWLDVLELMRRVEEEHGVRGLVLTLGGTELGWARYAELRERIVALEAAGKHVLVNLHGSPSNGEYFAATAASRVAMHPAGDLELIGLSFPLLHVRGTLELIGVEPQFVRRDEYKSAPETFTRTEPSEASLEQSNALLDDLYGELVGAIAAGRKLDEQRVRDLIDAGPYTAAEALEAGLVDVLAYPDELEGHLAGLHGGPVQIADLTRTPQPNSAWEEPSQIALVYVDGPIVPGESAGGGFLGPKTAGSETIVRALLRASEEPLVKAVVLRVDSPGGSSFASDEIWRAVELVQERGKPVVVSMGGVAASGGYYVAAGADAIWAEPNTITGSIGVYSGKMVVDELMENVGVHETTLVRGRNADLYSPSRRWDELQVAEMQSMIDEVYRQFKQRVADGRGMSVEAVDAIAGGRVWSGKAAKDVGLVDALGGFPDAIRDASRRAGIPEGRKIGLVSFTSGGTPLESLAPSIVGKVRAMALPASDRAALARIDDVLAPLTDTVFWTMYPNERVWLLDPALLEVP